MQTSHSIISPSGFMSKLAVGLMIGVACNLLIPASADAITGGTVTAAGTGYTQLPTFQHAAGGALWGATSLKAVSVTPATPGTGVAANDTFNIVGGTKTTAAIATVTNTQLVSGAVNAGGTGHAVGDVLTLAGGTFATAAQVTVTSVSAGVITGFNITRGGNYTVNSAALTQGATSGAGTGFTLQTGAFGAAAMTISTAGVYQAIPTNPAAVTNGTGTGTGVTLNPLYGVNAVEVLNSGSNYSSLGAPTGVVGIPAANDTTGTGATLSGTIGGAGNPVVINCPSNELPIAANYAIQVTSSMAAGITYKNKGPLGFQVVLTPATTFAAAGTCDVFVAG